MIRTALLIAALMLPSAPAIADMVTVSQTLTYVNDNVDDPNGPYFVARDYTLDHAPYFRGRWEDWGWVHDMNALKPTDAVSILSATLTLRTWDVDYPEVDTIFAVHMLVPSAVHNFTHTDPETGSPITVSLPAVQLGDLDDTNVYFWGSTSLTLPSQVLADLWVQHKLSVMMDIERIQDPNQVHRVTLAYSTLTVSYQVPHIDWEPNLPVYRFWSRQYAKHFFTAKEGEKNKLLNNPDFSIWWQDYEGVAFHTYPDKRDSSVSGVYRFYLAATGEHFYTIDEGEKDKLMAKDDPNFVAGIPSTWTYEGIAFYAHPEGQQLSGSLPVYRFVSLATGEHFYTIKEGEKNKLLTWPFSDVWVSEGIAWYAYP